MNSAGRRVRFLPRYRAISANNLGRRGKPAPPRFSAGAASPPINRAKRIVVSSPLARVLWRLESAAPPRSHQPGRRCRSGSARRPIQGSFFAGRSAHSAAARYRIVALRAERCCQVSHGGARRPQHGTPVIDGPDRSSGRYRQETGRKLEWSPGADGAGYSDADAGRKLRIREAVSILGGKRAGIDIGASRSFGSRSVSDLPYA